MNLKTSSFPVPFRTSFSATIPGGVCLNTDQIIPTLKEVMRAYEIAMPQTLKPAVASMPIKDRCLEFLKYCTSEELEPLEAALLEGQITCDLCSYPAYRAYPNDRTKYVGEMCHELQLFGGNTIANMFRGGKGVSYSELLCDVADKLDVNRRRHDSVLDVECKILNKVMSVAWRKMTSEERQALLKEIGCSNIPIGGAATSSFIAIFRLGGFSSYKVSLIIVNAIAKALLGRGLSLAANAALCKILSIATGPIGWVVGGVWTALDIASPAYRVTVPAVSYIAALRQLKIHAPEATRSMAA